MIKEKVSEVLCFAYQSNKFWSVAENIRLDGLFWEAHAAFCPDMKEE